MNTSTVHQILVLGAGYAGLTTAVRLARQVDLDSVSVTLVNAADEFVQRPRLHQAATGQTLPSLPLAELIGASGVELKLGWVRSIDTGAKTIGVRTGEGVEELAYDTLVYALGSRVDTSVVPGIAEHAHTLDPNTSERLHQAIPANGTIVVCGGGLSGIEAATEFAEAYPHLTVRLATRGEPGGWLSPAARKHLDLAFERLGVQVVSGVGIGEVAATELRLDDGSAIPFDLCVWAGGFTVPELAADAGLAVDRSGRAVVDGWLRSVSHTDVYVTGDAAALAGTWGDSIAYGCRTGGFQGPYLADAIAERLAGHEPKKFAHRYIHQCISLGRRDAVIQFVQAADESPRNAVLRGRVAVWYKDIVLKSAIWLFRNPGPYLPHSTVVPAAAEVADSTLR